MQFKKDAVRIILERGDIEVIEKFTDLINTICGNTDLKHQGTEYCAKCPLTNMCTVGDVYAAINKVPNIIL